MAFVAPIDSRSLSSLLSLFASALHGAVDAGTSSCLYHLDDCSFDRTAFLERGYAIRLRSLLSAIRSALRGKFPARLPGDVEAFLQALAALGNYESMTDETLADTIETLTVRFYDVRMALGSISRKTETRVKFLDALSADDEEYHMLRLTSLYGRLRHARAAGVRI
jgi:hypothetical protein